MNSQTIGRPMEVLLVEDSLADACLTIAALKDGQLQHRLTLIRDGEEAMEFLRKQGKFSQAPRPDIILLDLFLPKKMGLDVLAEVKEDLSLKEIPVIVMTGSEADEDKSRCESLHVDSYITKPVNLENFLGVVKKLKKHLLADVILPLTE